MILLPRITGPLRRLARDRRGVTALEFAFILPPLLVLFMGGSEVVYQVYVQSILDGAIQKAGRDSGIQGGAQNADALDAKVLDMVRVVAKTASFPTKPKREYYSSFSAMKPENFTDKNGNGTREAGECFDDINGNKTWDANPSKTGQGGANDVTLYTVTIRYPRLFPVAALMGWNSTEELTARTLLKNQPYSSQNVSAPVSICT